MKTHKSAINTLGKLFFWLICLGIATAALADGTKPLPENCRTECITPYGQVLGKTASNIEAYSNCRNDCVIFDPHHEAGTYTGIKWQCVEYARRWLLQKRGMVYGDVDIAADIWDKIDHYTQVPDGKKITLESIANGAPHPPAVGDLLIYAKELWGTGHVAVVTDVNIGVGIVRVAEQNFDNTPWNGPHARSIHLIKQDKAYWLLDAYLLGWKRISK